MPILRVVVPPCRRQTTLRMVEFRVTPDSVTTGYSTALLKLVTSRTLTVPDTRRRLATISGVQIKLKTVLKIMWKELETLVQMTLETKALTP